MMKQKLTICIATGIYPPELGGPAEYAQNMSQVWSTEGHTVFVEVFSRFNYLPTGVRHIVYFIALCKHIWKSDFVFILDTFSAALPAIVASKIFRKKTILRTGGDFLWEWYVERTGDLVLLKDFYTKHQQPLSVKEKIIFQIIRFILQQVDIIVWSTLWQKNIFMSPYGLVAQKHAVIENYYGERLSYIPAQNKNFVAATRVLKWKNMSVLKDVFVDSQVAETGVCLDEERAPHGAFLDKIRRSYAVIIPSLGDISPNTILDALMCGKPFIVTKETGLYERIKSVALFVDPKDVQDITQKILWLADAKNYESQVQKIREFKFTHTWNEIASEYIELYQKIT